jgi:hypothetical protein
MEWERSNCTQSTNNEIIKTQETKYNHRRWLSRKNRRCSRQILTSMIGERADLRENARDRLQKTAAFAPYPLRQQDDACGFRRAAQFLIQRGQREALPQGEV